MYVCLHCTSKCQTSDFLHEKGDSSMLCRFASSKADTTVALQRCKKTELESVLSTYRCSS